MEVNLSGQELNTQNITQLGQTTTLTPSEILELIPQQPPFRFVDEIIEVDENHIKGSYTFKANESFYSGHFPNKPITPGVILLESMCQIGVVALGLYLFSKEYTKDEASHWLTFFSDAQVEFLKSVPPQEKVFVHAEKIFWRKKKLCSNIQMFSSDGTLLAYAKASGMGVRK